MSHNFALMFAYHKLTHASQNRTTYHLSDLCLVKVFGHLDLFPLEATLFIELYVVLLAVKDDFVAPIDLSEGREHLDDPQPESGPPLLLVHHYVLDVGTQASVADEFPLDDDTAGANKFACGPVLDDYNLVHVCESGEHGIELPLELGSWDLTHFGELPEYAIETSIVVLFLKPPEKVFGI